MSDTPTRWSITTRDARFRAHYHTTSDRDNLGVSPGPFIVVALLAPCRANTQTTPIDHPPSCSHTKQRKQYALPSSSSASLLVFLISIPPLMPAPAFAMISGMITRRTLTLNFLSWKSWRKLSITKILSIWIFVDRSVSSNPVTRTVE